MGENVTWLVGHDRGIGSLGDVDMPVMTTFVQFYTTALKFVNFRLYKSVGLHYPPKIGSTDVAVSEGESTTGDGTFLERSALQRTMSQMKRAMRS